MAENELSVSGPCCGGALRPGPERWACPACGSSFDAWKGIPDLRDRDDVYLDNESDRAVARRLLDDFDRLDFRGLLGRYYDLQPDVPDDLRRRQIRHILTAPERSRRWLDALGNVPTGPLLDLGCGTGSFLAAVGHGLPWACGVDIALRWLLLARKRLDEAGLGRIPLVCAGAEALPFGDAVVAGVVAGDVIEHVGDQAATLAEIHRVLRPGGRAFLASPNRFSLAPEPHVGVWGVGYLPRRWMAGYVRRVKGVEFRAVRTLGWGEWSRLLGASPFREGQVEVPALPGDDLAQFGRVKRTAARVYNRLVTAPGAQWVFRRVGPLFHVVCERSADGRPSRPTPATPPRSTSRAGRT